MGARSEGTMRVHVHTKFCFLCVLTFLLQCVHCHDEGQHQGDHHGDHHGHHHSDHHGDHHGNGHTHKDIQISEAPYVGGATTLPAGVSATTTLDMLAEEQRFYIQQLFRRYGTQDRLDFQGFQSLLVSLGLGEVKVVGVEHEELGHDHVAHLDMLDMQEGLHSHLPAEDHGKAGHHHPHVKPAITKCSKPGGGNASLTADRGSPQDHNHTHNHEEDPEHIHEVQGQHKHSEGSHKGHTHDHDHDHKHGHGHSHHKGHTHAAVLVVPADREAASPPHDHEHPPQSQSTSNAASARPEQLPTTRTETPIATQQQRPEAAPLESEPPASMTESQTRRTRKPARARGQRGRNKTSSSSSSSSPPPHSLANRRRREAPGGPLAPTSSTPTLPDHLGGVAHQHKECLNLTLLLRYYGLTPDSQISQVQFTYLCPALLYQIDSRVCIRHYRQLEVEQKEAEAFSATPPAWVWLWGFVSITIISLLSLLGVILVPILNQSFFKFLLTFLVALAVGTLSGDALLHLLPHSQGQHNHGEPPSAGEEEAEDWVTAFDGAWKGLTALGGIYLLFIIEHCIGMVKHYKDQGVGGALGTQRHSMGPHK